VYWLTYSISRSFKQLGDSYLIRKAAVCAFILCALALWPCRTSGKEEYTIKLATIAPEGTSWADICHSVAQFVSEKTNSRAKIIWYFGGVMGDEPDVIRKIRMGQIHGGGFTLVGLGKAAPAVKVLELPFLFQGYDEVDHVLKELTPDFSRIFKKKGYLLAGWAEVGFVHFFTKDPARNLDELTRIKMWTWAEDVVAEEVLRAMGLRTIVPLNLTDVLSSLQTGLVDAYYGPAYATLALQWNSHVKYMMDFSIAYTPAAILMGKEFHDSLPEDIRDVLKEAWETYLPNLVGLIRKDEEASLDALKASGITVIHFDDDIMQEARTRTMPLYKELSGKLYPPSLLKKILSVLEEYRKTPRNQ